VHCADRVRRILASKNLTLYRVSRQSAELFGRASPYLIPHHLYSDLGIPLRPSIQQVATLSRISNYRLSDWLAVFGFDLSQIPQVQLSIQRRDTVLLDSSLYDENAWIHGYEETLPLEQIPGITPLGCVLRCAPPVRASVLTNVHRDRFLYAKLGEHDLLAFPDLVPGSIVRVDQSRAAERPTVGAGPSGQIFLVEHDSVLRCGRLQRSVKDRLVLCSLKFPFSRIELNLDPAFRIYGVVDGEMRPLAQASASCRLLLPGRRRSHRELRGTSRGAPALGELVRSSRLRAGLSFREASALSRQIAQQLNDALYFTAVGTLSECETRDHPPRHIQKIISICILYSIRFWDFVAASRVAIGPMVGEPIPDQLVPRLRPGMNPSAGERTVSYAVNETPFLAELMAEWSEIPRFSKDALAFVAGLKDLSLADLFWVGGDRHPIHPYLVHATFVVVSRRLKKPTATAAKTLWEQPLYMVLKRDGSFLCGACTLKDGLLSVHPYADQAAVPRRLRNGIDAEVIGQVTAIVRRLK